MIFQEESSSFNISTPLKCTSFPSLKASDPAIREAYEIKVYRIADHPCAISFWAWSTVFGTSNSAFGQDNCIHWRADRPQADWSVMSCKPYMCSACSPCLSSPPSDRRSECSDAGSSGWIPGALAASAVLHFYQFFSNQDSPKFNGTSPTLLVVKDSSASRFWPQIQWGGRGQVFSVAAWKGYQLARHSKKPVGDNRPTIEKKGLGGIDSAISKTIYF